MPEVMLVTVEKRDAKGAEVCRSRHCLVARAIIRQYGTEDVDVGSEQAVINGRRFDLDTTAVELIQAFDLHDIYPERMPELPVTITLTEARL